MLTSENIHLSPIHKKDSEVLFSWINNRDLLLYNAPYKPIMEQNHEQWMDSIAKSKDVHLFGIRENKNDILIGSCQLYSINLLARNAELQIRIGETSQRGKGYGSEAVQLLLQFGFNDLNLHRIYLHVFSDNNAAIKSYLKCGFKTEGTLRQAVFIDGKYADIAVMAILKEEFNARK